MMNAENRGHQKTLVEYQETFLEYQEVGGRGGSPSIKIGYTLHSSQTERGRYTSLQRFGNANFKPCKYVIRQLREDHA